jgi:hypothetical protein
MRIIQALGGPALDWLKAAVAPSVGPTVQGLKQMATDPMSHPQLGPVLKAGSQPFGFAEEALNSVVDYVRSQRPEAEIEIPEIRPELEIVYPGQSPSAAVSALGAPGPGQTAKGKALTAYMDQAEKDLGAGVEFPVPSLASQRPVMGQKEAMPEGPSWWDMNQDKVMTLLSGLAQGAAQPLPVGGGSMGLLLARGAAGMAGATERAEATAEGKARYEDLFGLKQQGLDIERAGLGIDQIRAMAALETAGAARDRAGKPAKRSGKEQRPIVSSRPGASLMERIADESTERAYMGNMDNQAQIVLDRLIRQKLIDLHSLPGDKDKGDVGAMVITRLVHDQRYVEARKNAIMQTVQNIMATDPNDLTPDELMLKAYFLSSYGIEVKEKQK